MQELAVIIDSNHAHVQILKRALSEIFPKILVASNPEEGIELCLKEPIDFVFIDFDFGASVLEKLKESHPALPLVACCAGRSLDDVVSALNAGAWEFFPKQYSKGISDRLKLIVKRCQFRAKQAERLESLELERMCFSKAAMSSSDGLAILSGDGRVLFDNLSFKRLLTNFCGHYEDNLWEIVKKYKPNFPEFLDRLASETFLKSTIRNEDNYLELSLTGFGSDNSGNDSPKYILWMCDRTEQKAKERFQSDLLSTTSHDLKGPLGAILTGAELLRSGENEPDAFQEKVIGRIAACARNSVNLIDELLSAKKLEEGLFVPHKIPVSINSIVQEVVEEQSVVANARSLNLTARLLEEDQVLILDPVGLKRVVGNLVSNALKFTTKGSIEVSVVMGDKQLVLSVSDTGAGISIEGQHLLFKRFQRTGETSSVDGTGLGLYVVKGIVQAHGGFVEVDSELGKGSVFSTYWPIISQEAHQQAEEQNQFDPEH